MCTFADRSVASHFCFPRDSEVGFYNNALEAVKRGRSKLVAANVPYKRPEDFLCEMVKTDAHMDKVLIDHFFCLFVSVFWERILPVYAVVEYVWCRLCILTRRSLWVCVEGNAMALPPALSVRLPLPCRRFKGELPHGKCAMVAALNHAPEMFRVGCEDRRSTHQNSGTSARRLVALCPCWPGIVCSPWLYCINLPA